MEYSALLILFSTVHIAQLQKSSPAFPLHVNVRCRENFDVIRMLGKFAMCRREGRVGRVNDMQLNEIRFFCLSYMLSVVGSGQSSLVNDT